MRRSLAAAVLLPLLLAGCTAEPPPEAVHAGTSTFVYVHNLGVVTDWDPASAGSGEGVALQNIYESLTVYNPLTQKAGPRLATTWRTSPDGRTWTFNLRAGVRFHSGRPLDAGAVKAALDRTIKSESESSAIWNAVEGIRAEGPLTVSFTLKYPAPLDLVASSGQGAYIYDTEVAPDLSGWLAVGRDAGSGPYTVQAWHQGERDELRLRAFDGYWGGWDRPRYRFIVFRVEPDARVAWEQLRDGEVSFVRRLGPRLHRAAGGVPGVKVRTVPSFRTAMLLFNTAAGPMADVRVRKAVQKAVDYEGVVDALDGAGVRASGIVPEGLFGHVVAPPPIQDLKGALHLLRQAGYGPGGRPLTLSLTYAEGDGDQRELVTRLAATLGRLNVTLSTKAMEWDRQWSRGKAGEQDIFLMYWWPQQYADASSWFADVFRGGRPPVYNLTYLSDPATDRLIDSLPLLTATDRPTALKTYRRLQNRLLGGMAVAAVPWVVTYQRAYLDGVRGYADNPAYPDVAFVYNLRPGA